MREARSMQRFLGFDHIDVRVRSLAAVEPFYDAIMPLLGLLKKTVSYVDEAGDWHDADATRYNTVEYFEEVDPGERCRFIGFIEVPAMTPVLTRIAFRVGSAAEVEAWAADLPAHGALNVERSEDMAGYPAVFFEDPAGTKLEICALIPKA